MNWRWVNKRALLLLHDESLAEHGGGLGIRDEGLLDSALARPLNLDAYGLPTSPILLLRMQSASRRIIRS